MHYDHINMILLKGPNRESVERLAGYHVDDAKMIRYKTKFDMDHELMLEARSFRGERKEIMAIWEKKMTYQKEREKRKEVEKLKRKREREIEKIEEMKKKREKERFCSEFSKELSEEKLKRKREREREIENKEEMKKRTHQESGILYGGVWENGRLYMRDGFLI